MAIYSNSCRKHITSRPSSSSVWVLAISYIMTKVGVFRSKVFTAFQRLYKQLSDSKLFFFTVGWSNINDFLGKLKKGLDLYSMVFVYTTCVVFFCIERSNRNKKKNVSFVSSFELPLNLVRSSFDLRINYVFMALSRTDRRPAITFANQENFFLSLPKKNSSHIAMISWRPFAIRFWCRSTRSKFGRSKTKPICSETKAMSRAKKAKTRMCSIGS